MVKNDDNVGANSNIAVDIEASLEDTKQMLLDNCL